MLIVKAVNIINKYFSKVFDISITIKYKRKKKCVLVIVTDVVNNKQIHLILCNRSGKKGKYNV